MDDGYFVTFLYWPGQNREGILQTLGYRGEAVGDELTYDDMGLLEQPGPAIAEFDDWFMLGDPHVQLFGKRTADGLLPVAWDPGLKKMPMGTCAWVFNCIGKSNTFAFTKLENGKIRRHYGINGGDFDKEVGEPLAEETFASDSQLDSEERLYNLLNRSGIPLAGFYDKEFLLYE